MLGSGPRGRHVLRFHSFHLACCPRRAQIGTWFLGDLMFHCSRPVLLPPSCAWLAALDVHRSVTWLLGDLMFHCSRPVLLPSPSYACVPSRPARRQSLHVRSLRRRLELVHSNTRSRLRELRKCHEGKKIRRKNLFIADLFFYSTFVL